MSLKLRYLRQMRLSWFMVCALFVKTAFLHAALPDLEIESIQIQPDRPSAKTPVTVIGSIRNNGSEPAGNFFVTLSLHKSSKVVKTIEEVPVMGSLPHQGSGLSVPVKVGRLAEGEYGAVLIVDPENRIRESNERNNQRVKTFKVGSPPFVERTYP